MRGFPGPLSGSVVHIERLIGLRTSYYIHSKGYDQSHQRTKVLGAEFGRKQVQAFQVSVSSYIGALSVPRDFV